MPHQSIFSAKYLKSKLAGFSLDQVDNLEEKKNIILAWEKSIREGKIDRRSEQELKPEFLLKFFGTLLEYSYEVDADENTLKIEKKSVTDSTTPDGALGFFTEISSDVRAVIEIKDGRTDLDKPQNRLNDKRSPVEQAFSYVAKSGGKCKWVIVSNFKEIRLYHASDQSRYEKFDLVELVLPQQQERFFYLLTCERLIRKTSDSPIDRLYAERIAQEQNITKDFYKEYKATRLALFEHLIEENGSIEQEILFAKAQKILDRLIFIRFCECLNLIPAGILGDILKSAKTGISFSDTKLWLQVQNLCKAIDEGYPDKSINKFNGGLFAFDEVLDGKLAVKDAMVERLAFLNNYDFESDLNVNILGHIFEQSISDIEETKAQIAGIEFEKKKGKKNKDGIFYTPPYITSYIVKEAVGGWLEDRKQELGFSKLPELTEDDIAESFKAFNAKTKNSKIPQKAKKHLEFWEAYEEKLRNIKVLDPACGSGAFLVQVFDYLFHEGQYVNQMKERLTGKPTLFDLQKHILTENIFGVDLNEESVEITKLSLWLKTANRSKELTTLDGNIQCGNSLIDDPAIAGEKAFKWKERFVGIMKDGGFDVVVGNPPYGAKFSENQIDFFRVNFETVVGHSEAYYLFVDKIINLLLQQKGILGLIIPNSWTSNKYAYGVRKAVLEKTKINEFINFNKKIIFEEANVETCILICTKIKTTDYRCIIGSDVFDNSSHSVFDYTPWVNSSDHIISFSDNNLVNSIIAKVNAAEGKFTDALDISNGFKPYQVGYGVNLQGNRLTEQDVKDYIYHSKIKIDDSYKRELKGRGVHRYSLEWEPSYVRWGKWLMSPKDEKYFISPKILIRQIISDYFFATIDTEKYYADQSLYTCINYPNDTQNHLEYFLALLNSRLYGFYFRKYYSEEDALFPKVKVNELKKLPLKILSEKDQYPFITLAEKMLNGNEAIQKNQNTFLKLLTSEFSIAKPTTKLQNWDTLVWEEFSNELKKAKVTIPLSRKAELMEYFEAEKAKATALRDEIKKTDKEIDKMVYELYGLTEEEIKVVEGLAHGQ